MTDFRLQRTEIHAPLGAPTYLTHVTVPGFRRFRAVTIALILHVATILAVLFVLHERRPPQPETEPALALVIEGTGDAGSGPHVAPQPMKTVQAATPLATKPAPPPPTVEPTPTPAVPAAVPVKLAAGPRPDLPLPPPPAPAAAAPAAQPHVQALAAPVQAAAVPAPPAKPLLAAAPAHLGDDKPVGQSFIVGQFVPASPDQTYTRAPDYPADARAHGEQGRVLLAIHIMPDGRPDAVKISRTSGYGSLDQAAEAAVLQWRFLAAKAGGKPVASVLPFWISFQLD